MSLSQNATRRRRQQVRPRSLIAWDAATNSAAQEVLRNTLTSACEVIAAERGFVLLLRDETALEVACARAIQPSQLLDLVLGTASAALRCALSERRPGLADCNGICLPPPGRNRQIPTPEETSPSVVALPLDLGLRHRGALCLLRSGQPRALSELDHEILDALSEQAALALRAANQESALSRLAASLDELLPIPA